MSKFNKYRLRQRAAGELARLFSAQSSHGDIDRIKRWRQQGADYQREFMGTAHALGSLDALANDPDILAAAETPSSERSGKWQWPVLAAAATLVAGLAVSLFVSVETGDPENALRYVTRIGEQKTVELEDGSIVTLNTGTELLVNITDSTRDMSLERGEVYFQVASDPQRPFSVNLGTRSVSVLGTQFNIQRLPDQFTLAVVEGVVSIHRRNEQVSAQAPLLLEGEVGKVHFKSPDQRRVKAGMVAEFDTDNDEVVAFTSTNIGKFHEWQSGLIRFDEEPLYKVVQQLNRYSGKKILIEDSSVMDLKIYATVRVKEIDKTLKGLEQSLPIKVVNHFDKIVIVKK